ncbi:hypothetical protein GCM10023238_36500 [Streptomyces heliomycini]
MGDPDHRAVRAGPGHRPRRAHRAGGGGARDKGDLDQLNIAPLPAQEAVLEAFGALGFGFRSADLEYGRIGGTGQQLPFYQRSS